MVSGSTLREPPRGDFCQWPTPAQPPCLENPNHPQPSPHRPLTLTKATQTLKFSSAHSGFGSSWADPRRAPSPPPAGGGGSSGPNPPPTVKAQLSDWMSWANGGEAGGRLAAADRLARLAPAAHRHRRLRGLPVPLQLLHHVAEVGQGWAGPGRPKRRSVSSLLGERRPQIMTKIIMNKIYVLSYKFVY